MIPIPGFFLPADLPWRLGFVDLVNDQLRRLRSTGHFIPPRFFAYFVLEGVPVGVAGSWTVSLDREKSSEIRVAELCRLTGGRYLITSDVENTSPDFTLIHDRKDGACWLWSFTEGMQFVESHDPTSDGPGDEEESRIPRIQ
ncbi:MAG TPA: hypothetical protein VFT82_01530 [Candidatus Paceibacterota bacterium]|nr:hypothetical protein [Candidatus Paceibacterota bacterium]